MSAQPASGTTPSTRLPALVYALATGTFWATGAVVAAAVAGRERWL
ncbi:hypothetical protein OG563_34710 [Nocardia vinacea]|uniref:EamA family transporter n=1 Tax=Nocardia vinacea TaxID=96468 RepID=A0ABZ1YM40_9NOCA|nr:hypothetical protein [Nocardia vinacea]